MSTILKKVIPNKKVKCRIIKEGFTHSAILGHPVYLGKIVTLNSSTANRFIEAGIVELVDGETESQTETGVDSVEKLSLDDALLALDHEDDAHWTKFGLPDLNVLKELTGHAVKRADLPEDFVREGAVETDTDESSETDADEGTEQEG